MKKMFAEIVVELETIFPRTGTFVGSASGVPALLSRFDCFRKPVPQNAELKGSGAHEPVASPRAAQRGAA